MQLTDPETRPVRRLGRPRHLLAVVATAGMLLAACGSPPTSGDQEAGGRTTGTQSETDSLADKCPIDALDEASGPINVDLWYGGLGGDTQTTMEDMAKAFNASQDQIVVSANNQGRSYEEVLRKYEGASATPAQLPQVIYLEDTALGQMVDKGQVLPAQACMEADDYDLTQIVPTARTAFSVDGTLYPGYMNVSTPVLYYNKVIFSKAGLDPDDPPETLEEIQAAAQTIKDAGLAVKPFSFKVNRWFMENWLSGVGIDSVDNDNGRSAAPTAATFDTPEAVEVLTILKQMNDDGLLNPFASTEGDIDHFLALLPPEGGVPQSAMLVETSTASTTIASVVSGQLTAAEAGVDFDESIVDREAIVPGGAPFPGLESGGKVNAGGGAFFILNTSDPAQQAASWKFLEFMLQPENAKVWHMKGGYLPIVKSVMDDDEVQAFWSDTMAGVIVRPAVDQLKNADPDQAGPLIGPYVPFTDALQGAMEKVLLSGGDPATELAAGQVAANRSFADYNDE